MRNRWILAVVGIMLMLLVTGQGCDPGIQPADEFSEDLPAAEEPVRPVEEMHPDLPPDEMGQASAPVKLGEVEVTEFQGKGLDPITIFRENSIRGAQNIDIDEYRLKIFGLVDNYQELTYEEVLAYDAFQKQVTLFCVEGWDADVLWEGVKIADLIDTAGAQADANTVIFHADDGYTSSLPLEYIRDNDILLAYGINGLTLPDDNGYPFQVVAEEKWGYKWVRWVTGIELSDDPEFEGYWEKRGYSNKGDVDGPIFG